MSKLNQHKERFQLGLCLRDYNRLLEYHSEVLNDLEAALEAGATLQDIKRWVLEITNEEDMVRKVVNAARYAMEVANQ